MHNTSKNSLTDIDMMINKKVNIQKKISIDQYRLLNQNLLINLIANFICSTVVFFTLYEVSQMILIWSWYGAVILTTFIRFFSFYFYRRYPQYNKLHFYFFIFGLTLSATLWGVAVSFLLPQNDLLRQMIVIVIGAGITAGGIQTLQASLTACIIFVNLVIMPLVIWLFLQNTVAYDVLGVAMATYLIFMLIISWRNHHLLKQALHLYYKNLELVENLSFSNKQLQQREHDMILINKMNEMLQTCNESKEAYQIINRFVQDLFINLSGGLGIFSQLNNDIEIVTQWGDHPILRKTFSIRDCWALREGHAYIIDDSEKNLICEHLISVPISSVCLPLVTQSGVLGLLYLNTHQNKMSNYQLELASTFTEVIKLSLANIQLREKLHEQTIHDPLTGLFNRRYLNESLSRELKRVIRENNFLCVCMFDLDHFKTFNDTNGHEAGDEVLKFLSVKLREHFRGSDIACRFGGEEFIVILINTDIDAAISRMEYIRKEIKQARLYFKDELLQQITVSIGIAEAPTHGQTLKEIIRAADEALYLAKEKGRDRVETFNRVLVSS